MSITEATIRHSPDFTGATHLNHPGRDFSSGHPIGKLGVVFMVGGSTIFFLSILTLITWLYFRAPDSQANNSKIKDEEVGLDRVALESWFKIKYADTKHLPEGRRAAGACCSVCLGDFGDEDELRQIQRCGHLFHAQCVDPWLRKQPTCPLCRSVATPASPQVKPDGQNCAAAP